MNRNILAGVFILVVAAVIIAYLLAVKPQYNNFKSQEDAGYARKNITFLKFVSSENCLYSFDDSEIEELKSLDINGIRICPLYRFYGQKIIEDVPEKEIISLLKKAHSKGFSVFLEVNLASRGGFSEIKEKRYLDELEKIAVHWAEISEKENVEFYSPLNEPNVVFPDDLLFEQWLSDSRNLKQFFKGNLVAKFAEDDSVYAKNITGYDYLALDIILQDSNDNEIKDYINSVLDKGNEMKKKCKLKGFFFGEIGVQKQIRGNNIQAKVFRTVLNQTWGKTDGYCFLGWSNLEFSFRNNYEAKKTIREWYSRQEYQENSPRKT